MPVANIFLKLTGKIKSMYKKEKWPNRLRVWKGTQWYTGTNLFSDYFGMRTRLCFTSYLPAFNRHKRNDCFNQQNSTVGSSNPTVGSRSKGYEHWLKLSSIFNPLKINIFLNLMYLSLRDRSWNLISLMISGHLVSILYNLCVDSTTNILAN